MRNVVMIYGGQFLLVRRRRNIVRNFALNEININFHNLILISSLLLLITNDNLNNLRTVCLTKLAHLFSSTWDARNINNIKFAIENLIKLIWKYFLHLCGFFQNGVLNSSSKTSPTKLYFPFDSSFSYRWNN